MTFTFKTVCIVLALVAFGLAAFKVPEHPRVSYMGVGSFFLTGALFVNA